MVKQGIHHFTELYSLSYH
uniref:Uncharacterized protein n=1 Tax=Arundo donax TaxID=35708 RepID=A0A0A9ACG5_ARUDO